MQTTTHPRVSGALPNSGTHKLPYGSYFPETVSFKVLVLLGRLLLSGAVMGQTYYVKTTGNDAGIGTSWSDAFRTVQKALAAAGDGTQIWVAQGTYYPDDGPTQTDNDRNVSFLLKNDVAIYGGFAGDETQVSQRNWQTHVTLLSGDLQQNDGPDFFNNGENALHVVQGNGTNSTAVLDGFTVTAGNASFGDGGGLLSFNSSPTLTNCSFLGNKATTGGAIFMFGSSILVNCSFSGNKAGVGGAIYLSNSSSTIVNCSFSGNIANAGGGIYSNNSSSTLSNCILWGNLAPAGPEIITTFGSAAPTVTYSIVQGSFPGAGNKDQDPLFVDAASGNLHLLACSPAIDAGDNAANTTSVDLDGNARKVDAIASGSQIDMGVYEFQGDLDADNDGYSYCNNEDCNDNDSDINPNTVWIKDGDGDGFYSDIATQCIPPAAGYVIKQNQQAGDCNDNDPDINPNTVWVKDGDGDEFYTGAAVTQCSSPGAGYVIKNNQQAGDCNDNDPAVHSQITYYRDVDGDGYGSSVSAPFCSSTPPVGYSTRTGDLNDNDPAISPGAVEVCGNKVDDNCNGIVDENTCYPCQNGTNLTTTNITSNSAQLNWNATANAQQWQLQYKTTASGSKWTDVLLTGNIRSVKISSLKANQTYNWHIRAKCNGKWTAYSSSATFKTAGSISSSIITSAIAANNSTLSLYPNPTKGQFVIELNVREKVNTNAKIQLTDLTGRTVQTENAEINNGTLHKTVNISSALAKGIYMVRIIANDRMYPTKLVYEK